MKVGDVVTIKSLKKTAIVEVINKNYVGVSLIHKDDNFYTTVDISDIAPKDVML